VRRTLDEGELDIKEKKMNKKAEKSKPGKKTQMSATKKKRPITSFNTAAEKGFDITERKRAEV
jgi:hypothetical protein